MVCLRAPWRTGLSEVVPEAVNMLPGAVIPWGIETGRQAWKSLSWISFLMRTAVRWNPTLKNLGRFPDHLLTLEWVCHFTLRTSGFYIDPKHWFLTDQEILLLLAWFIFFFLLNNYSCASMTVASFSIIKASELYLGSWLDHLAHVSSSAQADLVLQFRQGAHRALGLTSPPEWLLFWLNKQHMEENYSYWKKNHENIETPLSPFRAGTNEPSEHL